MNIPYVPISGMGLQMFSMPNKLILKQRIEKTLKDAATQAFKSTYLYDNADDGNEIAEKFGEAMSKAADNIATAIDGYVRGCIKAQSIMIVPKGTLISPMGPVTGMLSTTTKDVVVS